jgi:hypothetical protein
MTENTAKAPKIIPPTSWHVSFTWIYSPESMEPNYLDCKVSKSVGSGDEKAWYHDGIASFEGPKITPPMEGDEIITFLLHHLFKIRDYLTEEYVQRLAQGVQQYIRPEVGVSMPPGVIRSV